MNISAQLERLWRRIWLIVAPARVTTGRDDGPVQFLQVKIGSDEVRDNTPRMSEYGFASMPTEGSDAILVFVGGDRSNGAIIATGNQAERLKNLKPGESAIWDSLGKCVYLTQDGIVVEAAGQPVTVSNATVVTVIAAEKIIADTPLLSCTGDIIDNSGSNTHTMAQMREIYNTHTHVVAGIQTGSGSRTSNPPTQIE